MHVPSVAAVLISLAFAYAADNPPPALTIATASPTDGLIISTTSANFNRTFDIINTTKKTVPLAVELPALVGPDSNPIQTTWQLDGRPSSAASTEVKPLSAAHLTVAATLAAAGVYTSAISLIYGDTRVPVNVKITRATAAPTVSVVGADPVAFDGFFGDRLIRFSLKETAGVKVQLRAPRLASFTRKSSDKVFQASHGAVKFRKANSQGAWEDITDPLQIGPSANLPLQMQIEDWHGPGEYTASLDISSADGSLAPQSITFYYKRPWFLALLLISIGVLLSHWLRHYTKVDRPRLIYHRRVLQLQGDLESLGEKLPDKPDRNLLDALRARLDRTDEDIRLGLESNPDPLLKDINAKLSLVADWSNLRRSIDAAQPASVADEVRPALKKVAAFIGSGQIAKAEDLTAASTQMAEALTKLDAAIRKQLQDTIKAVQDQVTGPRADLAPIRQGDFDSQVVNVLASAADATQKSPPDDASARRLVDQAQRAYATILVNDLDDKLTSAVKPPPAALSDWSAIVAEFTARANEARAAATGNAAVAAAQFAYAAYLRALILVASEAAREVQPRVADANDKIALDNAVTKLQTAQNLIRNRELTAAKARYDEARTVISQLTGKYPPPAKMDASGAPAPETPPLSSATTILSIPGLLEPGERAERRKRVWRDIADLDRQLTMRDFWRTVLTLAIAIALGLYGLWVDSLTWGSLKDLFIAVLWGLGLHQVAGNIVFAKLDLGQLEDQVAGTKPAAAS